MPNAMCFSRAIYHRTGISIDFQLDFNGLVGWSLNFKGVGKIVFFFGTHQKTAPSRFWICPIRPSWSAWPNSCCNWRWGMRLCFIGAHHWDHARVGTALGTVGFGFPGDLILLTWNLFIHMSDYIRKKPGWSNSNSTSCVFFFRMFLAWISTASVTSPVFFQVSLRHSGCWSCVRGLVVHTGAVLHGFPRGCRTRML
jgi:hypothetical protein